MADAFSLASFTLAMNVMRGSNLLAADITGSSDPYVLCRLADAAPRRSQTVSRTLHPTYMSSRHRRTTASSRSAGASL